MNREEGQRALRAYIRSFFDNPRDMAIRTPSGLGKTSKFEDGYKSCYAKFPRMVEYYVPNHALAEEVRADIFYRQRGETRRFGVGVLSGIPVQIIRGRDYPDRNGNPHCRKYKVARELSVRGISVYDHLCRDNRTGAECRYIKNCPYLRQFEREAFVRIYTHAYLGILRGLLDNELPEFAVIDESFHTSFLKHGALPVSDLNSFFVSREFRQALMDSFRGRDFHLSAMRDRFGDELQRILHAMQNRLDNRRVAISPEMGHREQLRRVEALNINPNLKILLQNLATELETGREFAHGITMNNGEINLHWRNDITRFEDSERKAPVLAIDADLKPEIHRVFFPGAEFHPVSVPRRCHVTQVTSTRCSTTSLVPDRQVGGRAQQQAQRRIVEVQRLIDREAEFGSVLVVGPQDVTGNPRTRREPLIHVPSNSALAHFNSIRGIDAFKDFDTAIIIGRNQPSLAGLENEARALWFDSDDPLEFVNDWDIQERGYRLSHDEPGGVNVQVHPDRRIQMLHEQIRESESTQAIDRLRLIHNATPKRVIVLSNVVLDITVDRLVTWPDLMAPESKLVQVWRLLDGVLPLSPSWLAHEFPEVFRTRRIARDQTGRKLVDNISNIISISHFVHLSEYNYRLQGVGSGDQRCLSQFDEEDTVQELENLHDRKVLSIRQVRAHGQQCVLTETLVAASSDEIARSDQPCTDHCDRNGLRPHL